MKCKGLGAWWANLFKEGPTGPVPETKPSSAPLQILPLTVAMRVDFALTHGRGTATKASRIIWLSSLSSRSAGGLGVLITQN